jgi:hypothetical protein
MYIHEHISGIQGAPMVGRFVPRPELDVKKHGASDEAVAAATAVMDKLFWSLRPSNVDILRGLSIHLHIIPCSKKATDVAEFRKLKDKTAPNGRSYDSVRAVDAMRSGSRIEYAVGEESIVEGFVVARCCALCPDEEGAAAASELVQRAKAKGRRLGQRGCGLQS